MTSQEVRAFVRATAVVAGILVAAGILVLMPWSYLMSGERLADAVRGGYAFLIGGWALVMGLELAGVSFAIAHEAEGESDTLSALWHPRA